MAGDRYANRSSAVLTKRDMFKQVKERRGQDSISIYGTPRFNRITDRDLQGIDYESYIWSRGDRFFKLAHDYYGDVNYWWVIPLFNNVPTEHHLDIGEEIFIPIDKEVVTSILGVE
tara:strand:- start:275 stop:622 length:348 start_codon:yes stop_codon:yes gene_type:complete